MGRPGIPRQGACHKVQHPKRGDSATYLTRIAGSTTGAGVGGTVSVGVGGEVEPVGDPGAGMTRPPVSYPPVGDGVSAEGAMVGAGDGDGVGTTGEGVAKYFWQLEKPCGGQFAENCIALVKRGCC